MRLSDNKLVDTIISNHHEAWYLRPFACIISLGHVHVVGSKSDLVMIADITIDDISQQFIVHLVVMARQQPLCFFSWNLSSDPVLVEHSRR